MQTMNLHEQELVIFILPFEKTAGKHSPTLRDQVSGFLLAKTLLDTVGIQGDR